MDQVFCLEDHEENLDYDGTEDIILDNDVDEELIKGGGNSDEAGTSTGPVVKAQYVENVFSTDYGNGYRANR